MTTGQKSAFVLSRRHLLGIEGLSRDEISGLLDLAEEFVELNRQIEKKRASLRGRTQINLFFEALNLTNEVQSTHGRFDNQLLDVFAYGRRYTAGARFRF